MRPSIRPSRRAMSRPARSYAEASAEVSFGEPAGDEEHRASNDCRPYA